MLDMIGVPISFGRRRRVDLRQLALTLRQNAHRRADLWPLPFARSLELHDARQCGTLVGMSGVCCASVRWRAVARRRAVGATVLRAH